MSHLLVVFVFHARDTFLSFAQSKILPIEELTKKKEVIKKYS